MERKKKYCPQCGDKTNDIHCIICGRATKSIENRFNETYLNLVSDDIETFDHIQAEQKSRARIYDNTIRDEHENLDRIEKNVQFHRRKHNESSDDTFTIWKTRIASLIIILVVLAVIANIAFDIFVK